MNGVISGDDCIGGIVGRAVSVKNCSNYGSVNGKSSVGGIVGFYNGYGNKISNCFNSGTITSEDNKAGGISGLYGYIYTCYNKRNCNRISYYGKKIYKY